MPQPFLLDPGYADTLNSTAFRRRFAALHLDWVHEGIKFGAAVIAVLSLLVPGLLYWLTRKDGWVIALMIATEIALPFLLIVVLRFWWIGDWLTYFRMRRLARHGNLREGVVLAARRVRVPSPGPEEEPFVAVEIEYGAEAPSGVHVQGVGRRRRDDLLNAELPAPGTPVVVLLVNEKTHAIL